MLSDFMKRAAELERTVKDSGIAPSPNAVFGRIIRVLKQFPGPRTDLSQLSSLFHRWNMSDANRNKIFAENAVRTILDEFVMIGTNMQQRLYPDILQNASRRMTYQQQRTLRFCDREQASLQAQRDTFRSPQFPPPRTTDLTTTPKVNGIEMYQDDYMEYQPDPQDNPEKNVTFQESSLVIAPPPSIGRRPRSPYLAAWWKV